MYSKRVVLGNKLGLHARPASEFVAVARNYESNITVSHVGSDGPEVDGKNPMRLLSGSFYGGDEIEISAEGADEREAVSSLVAFVNSLG